MLEPLAGSRLDFGLEAGFEDDPRALELEAGRSPPWQRMRVEARALSLKHREVSRCIMCNISLAPLGVNNNRHIQPNN